MVGKDSIVIGQGDIKSEIGYSGTQTLSVDKHGRVARYVAKVDYARTDQGATTQSHATYVSDLLPTGEQLDSSDRDPDYMTVLNQPFSIKLDPATLRDLAKLHGALPFDVPSPFSNAILHGRLSRTGVGTIAARPALGVTFSAAGPMQGSLPDRPGLVLKGTIEMRGTAFYGVDDAVLLALDTTVTITGSLSNRASADPVSIVYHRTIRASEPSPEKTARDK